MTTETVKTEKASVYEVGYHIVPAVSPENLPKEVEAVKAVLGAQGATIISEEEPKLIPLSYTMVKAIGPNRHRYDTAYFGWIKFEAAPEAVAEINKVLDASEKILRYLLIKTVRENTIYGPKILPQEKDEKESVKDESKGEEVKEDIDKSIEKLVV